MSYPIASRIVVTLLFVLVLTALPQDQKPPTPVKQETSEDEIVRVETTLVTVPVVVRSKNGGYIPNLRAGDFRLFENGIEQEVSRFETTDKPFTVALVLDVSDSTKIDLSKIQNAAISFLEQLRPADRAFIVTFDKQVVKLAEATQDRIVLAKTIRSVRAGGGTALYDAVASVISTHNRSIGGRKAIVILTDGIDTSSTFATFESTTRLAAEQYSSIYPIQFNPDNLLGQRAASMDTNLGLTLVTTPSGESIGSAFQRGTRYLRLLAQSSGGRFYHADNIKNLERTFSQIADELRQQYTVGYYPKDQDSTKEKRRIKVQVNAPEAEIKTRENYIFRPDQQR